MISLLLHCLPRQLWQSKACCVPLVFRQHCLPIRQHHVEPVVLARQQQQQYRVTSMQTHGSRHWRGERVKGLIRSLWLVWHAVLDATVIAVLYQTNRGEYERRRFSEECFHVDSQHDVCQWEKVTLSLLKDNLFITPGLTMTKLCQLFVQIQFKCGLKWFQRFHERNRKTHLFLFKTVSQYFSYPL